MNELQLFRYRDRQVRTALNDRGEIFFVAKDVCEILGIDNVSQAVSRLDGDEKDIILNDTLGGTQSMAAVTESGLYALTLTSRKPEAKAFKKWVTSEVLPSINKTGTYSLQSRFNLPKTFPEALRMLADAEEQKALQAERILELEPKGQVYDRCMTSDDALDMGVVAKMFGIGRNVLFQTLRLMKVLMENNVPYQEYAHHFKVIEKPWEDNSGSVHVALTTKVRQSGLGFLARKLGEVRAHDAQPAH